MELTMLYWAVLLIGITLLGAVAVSATLLRQARRLQARTDEFCDQVREAKAILALLKSTAASLERRKPR